MGFLDRAISAISPRWGAKRAAWQAQENRIRGYDAASRTDPRNLGWVPDIGPAQLQITRDGTLIRGRARELENNSDVVNAVIDAIARNVIGLGFELQAQTPSARLNEQIEELWAEWCRPQNCDITGTQGLSSLLQMILRRKIVDGGILIQKVYARGSGPCTFRLQVLEVDSLTSPLVPRHKGNSIVDGIECDRYLRPRGYWVLPYQPDGLMYQQRTEPYYVAAKDMIFYFTKRRPTQVREVSDLVHVLERVRDANEFAKDVAEKQKVEAKFAAYITRTVDSGAGRGSFLRDQSADSTKHGYTEIAPGMIFDLNPGESMGALNPTGPVPAAPSAAPLPAF